MNRFVVNHLDPVAADAGIGFECHGHVANEVFHKFGVGIRMLCHPFFVCPFEQAPKLAGGIVLGHAHQLAQVHGPSRVSQFNTHADE